MSDQDGHEADSDEHVRLRLGHGSARNIHSKDRPGVLEGPREQRFVIDGKQLPDPARCPRLVCGPATAVKVTERLADGTIARARTRGLVPVRIAYNASAQRECLLGTDPRWRYCDTLRGIVAIRVIVR